MHLSKITINFGSVLILLAASASIASASGITMSSKQWHVGDEITVTGDDLEGQYVKLKRLCFSPATNAGDVTCFGTWDAVNKVVDNADDPYLKRWEREILVFDVPPTLPVNGTLKLMLTNDVQDCSDGGGCITLPEEQDVVIGDFSVIPHIDEVLDASSGLPATAITAGNKYEIKGSLFGSEKQKIFFGKVTSGGASTYITWQQLSMMDITSWSDQDIIFQPSTSYDISGGLKINNTVSDSNILMKSDSENILSSNSSLMTSSVSSSSGQATTFSDVASNDPYAPAIQWAKAQGVLQGYPDGTFKPNNVVNRAEFLKIVLGAKGTKMSDTGGKSGFNDVDENGWYAPYVRYAKAQGIIQGYPDETFRPNQAVSFAEALKMAYAALGVATPDASGEWYQRYLQHAKSNGILFSNNVDVGSGMTRKDVVWIVWKLMLSH